MPEENTTNTSTSNTSLSSTNVTASDTMVAALSEKRNNLISASYENPGEEKITRSSAKAIVDILNNYAWANETAKSSSDLSFNLKTNIPYCLLIEREQTVTSSIMNIVRDVGVVGQGFNKILSGLKNLGVSGANKISDSVEEAGKKFEGLISDNSQNIVASLVSNLEQNIVQNARINGAESGESILSPYNYLYATEMTGFRYVFPMLNGQDLYALTNQWTDEQSTYTSLLLDPDKNPIISFIRSTAGAVASTVGSDIPNLLNIFRNGANANKNAVYEMAKYFNFSEEGDEVKIDFALFNTVVKNGIIDQWKRNLYFISLFNMRNLPFKLDYTTFLPPLLYDVIIPGVKRLPFAYVSSFTAEPQGLIRNMPVDNFLSKIAGIDTSANNKVSVPIPEAWVISITFKSMLSRSANLMLAGGADLPISINMSSNDYAEYANSIEDATSKDLLKPTTNEQLEVPKPENVVIPTVDRPEPMIAPVQLKPDEVDLGLDDMQDGAEDDPMHIGELTPPVTPQQQPANKSSIPQNPIISNTPTSVRDTVKNIIFDPMSTSLQNKQDNIPTTAAPLSTNVVPKSTFTRG